ncbi:hypothetical protein RFI_20420 [Reticulomyxa filosa]|uniref:Uncharacterized protein n=1 Tax=Reticulomyxa filosa TaxID=46433 RepID=X6MU21_RETFI|nr:hypothetical protein RFI_20420 [Reticulomyxa filosa]|eukprot:ETO16917.1 hypothetical protein RFI_20420 [Reticulomyxa filosa]
MNYYSNIFFNNILHFGQEEIYFSVKKLQNKIKTQYTFLLFVIIQQPQAEKHFYHGVVKLEDNNNNNKDRNEVTLLSFGFDWYRDNEHTLVMKYISVWNSDNDNEMKSNNYNEWIPS